MIIAQQNQIKPQSSQSNFEIEYIEENERENEVYLGIRVDSKLHRMKITLEGYRIYAFLCFCVSFDVTPAGLENACKVSYKRIIEACLRDSYPYGGQDYLKRKAIDGINELVSLYLVEKIATTDDSGATTANLYKLLPKSKWKTESDSTIVNRNIRGQKDIKQTQEQELERNFTLQFNVVFPSAQFIATPGVFGLTPLVRPITPPSATYYTPLIEKSTNAEKTVSKEAYNTYGIKDLANKDEENYQSLQKFTNLEEKASIVDVEVVSADNNEETGFSSVYNNLFYYYYIYICKNKIININNIKINNNLTRVHTYISAREKNQNQEPEPLQEKKSSQQEEEKTEPNPRKYKPYLCKDDQAYLVEVYNRHKPEHWFRLTKVQSRQRMQIESLLREMFNPGGIEEIVEFIANALEWVKGDTYWKDKSGGLHSLLYNENFVQWGTNYQEGFQHSLQAKIDISPLIFETGVEVSVYDSPPQSIEEALERANTEYGEYGQESTFTPLPEENSIDCGDDNNSGKNLFGNLLSKMGGLNNKIKDIRNQIKEIEDEKRNKSVKQNRAYDEWLHSHSPEIVAIIRRMWCLKDVINSENFCGREANEEIIEEYNSIVNYLNEIGVEIRTYESFKVE